MINVKDVLAEYKENLRDYSQKNLNTLDDWTDFIDNDVSDNLLLGENYTKTDDHWNTEYINEFNTLKSFLLDKSLMTKDGIVLVTRYENYYDEPSGLREQRVYLGNHEILYLYTQDVATDPAGSGKTTLEVKPEFDTPIGEYTNFADMISSGVEALGENVAISQFLSEALSLYDAGNLTVSSLYASCSPYIENANGAVKNCFSSLVSSISGTPESTYGMALVANINNLVSGIKTASVSSVADGINKIDFSNTDWTINTSCLGAVVSVVKTAAGLLSAAFAVVSPIISVAINAITTTISAVKEAINSFDNTSLNFNFNTTMSEEVSNHLFVVPFMQSEVDKADITDINIPISENNPFVIYKNGLLEVRVWAKDNDYGVNATYRFEGFLNFMASCDRIDTYNNTHVINMINSLRPWHVGTPANPYFVPDWTNTQVTDFQDFKHEMDYATDEGFMQGPTFMNQGSYRYNQDFTGDLTDEDHFKAYTLKVVYATALLYLLATTKVDRAVVPASNPIPSLVGDMDLFKSLINYYDIDGLMMYLYWLNYKSLDIHDLTLQQCRDLLASVVNTCIPKLREFINEYANVSFIFSLLGDFEISSSKGSVFGIQKIKSTTSGYITYNDGSGHFFFPSLSTPQSAFWVTPPSSTISIWWTIAATAACVAAVVVSSVLIINKIKKKVQYKAWKKRNSVVDKVNTANETGTYEDWNIARKATRKYNRFYGRLTGNTYDMNNDWLEYNSSSGAVENVKLSNDLKRVINLIAPSN